MCESCAVKQALVNFRDQNYKAPFLPQLKHCKLHQNVSYDIGPISKMCAHQETKIPLIILKMEYFAYRKPI